MSIKRIITAGTILLLGIATMTASTRQRNHSDKGGHILALDNSWNRALETKKQKIPRLWICFYRSDSVEAAIDPACGRFRKP